MSVGSARTDGNRSTTQKKNSGKQGGFDPESNVINKNKTTNASKAAIWESIFPVSASRALAPIRADSNEQRKTKDSDD